MADKSNKTMRWSERLIDAVGVVKLWAEGSV